MNLLEAIEQCKNNPDLWFRPSAGYAGQAFSIEKGRIIPVPTSTGSPFMPYYVWVILSEWEVVNPDEVLGER